jgi:carbonic anhydrase
MTLSRRAFWQAGLAVAATSRSWAQSHSEAAGPSADAVLHELVEGNLRFARSKVLRPHTGLSRVRQTAAGQHPLAVVLTCSDSRVPPEVLFDQGIGDLFVVRVAGNVANNDQIGSVEYAVEHLGCPVCVVLGHSSCGAVTAVVNGDHVTEDIARMVVHIGEAVGKTRKAHPELQGKALIEPAVQANVEQALRDLTAGSELLAEKVRSGKLRLVGANYSVQTGKVNWGTAPRRPPPRSRITKVYSGRASSLETIRSRRAINASISSVVR